MLDGTNSQLMQNCKTTMSLSRVLVVISRGKIPFVTVYRQRRFWVLPGLPFVGMFGASEIDSWRLDRRMRIPSGDRQQGVGSA